MYGRISIETSGDTTVVAKRVSGSDARRRLSQEAAVLQELCHPGVVRFVRFEDGPDHAVLVTESAGAVSMADHRPSTPGGVAALGAAVAGTVADLHDEGWGHGAIQADHVILGASRHPVLCSFGRASRDPAVRASDLVALADLITEVAAAVSRSGGRSERHAVDAIEDAAARARGGDIDARQLAGLLAAVPGASLSTPAPAPTASDGERAPVGGPTEIGTRTWRLRAPAVAVPELSVGRRRRWALATLVAAVGLVGTGLSLRGADTEAPAVPEAPARSTQVAAAPPAPSTAEPPPVVAEPTPCPRTFTAGVDVDGDGCGDDAEVVGRLIRVGDIWYTAGRPGDVVALDHWGCAAIATPAILRPDTGEVFVFDRWPARGLPLTVREDHRVQPGATVLRSSVVDGCPTPTAGGVS